MPRISRWLIQNAAASRAWRPARSGISLTVADDLTAAAATTLPPVDQSAMTPPENPVATSADAPPAILAVLVAIITIIIIPVMIALPFWLAGYLYLP